MDAQLTLLMEIQELSARVRELRSGTQLGVLEEQHFGIDLEGAAESLEHKVEELVGQLDERVRRRYHLLAGRVDRVLVPVISGTCYGCLVSIATATAGDRAPNATLQTCENCGRFLFILV